MFLFIVIVMLFKSIDANINNVTVPLHCKSTPACILTYSSNVSEVINEQLEVLYKVFKCSEADLTGGRTDLLAPQYSGYCLEGVLQVSLDDERSKKKASATFLYRNPSPFYSRPSIPACDSYCSIVSDGISNAEIDIKREFVKIGDGVGRVRNRTDILENFQMEMLLNTMFAIGEMNFSMALLHLGCTTRARGNDHDVSRIVTDMQPFNCSSLPPTGDGPLPRTRPPPKQRALWMWFGVSLGVCCILVLIFIIVYASFTWRRWILPRQGWRTQRNESAL